MARKKINASSYSSLYDNRKKHKSPTKQGKTRQRTQAQKEKENRRRRQIGQSRALFELEDSNIIYYLGQEPTYIHSNEVYFRKGRIKARELLNINLQKLVREVQSQITEVIMAVDIKIKNILSVTGFSTFNQFAQWWETTVQPHTNVINDSEALYYLTLLERFKTNATLISSYRYTRDKYPNDVKRLIDNGFVLADFQLTSGARARKEDPITLIRENQRQIIQELASYLKTKLPTSDDMINRAINDILNGATQNNIEKAYAFNIGQIHEYLFAKLEKWVADGYEFVINNVAAEKHSDLEKNSKDFKADSLVTINKQSENINISVQFYTSDKSGMRYQYGHKYDANIKNTLDLFTAGITSDTYDIFNITSSVDINMIDPQINNLFSYIIRNSDWFGIKDIATKDLIMSFFAWAKLIVEITGYTDNANDFVPIIRMFNRLYSTSDLLRRFQRIKNRDILGFVNKAYLTEYYNVYTFGTSELKSNLYEEKKQFLTTNGENVSYRDIKKAILKTLEQLNLAATKRPGFATSYAIVMGNINNFI